MVIDETFIHNFKNQICVLTHLRDTVQGALDRANMKLNKLNQNVGKNVEDVFDPTSLKQSPGAQAGRGKDYR